MNNATITLEDYLNKGKTFVIPDYQRGYVWGKERSGGKNSVEYFIDDLINKFNSKKEIFLQGVTVTESDDKIVLIDGQQRTTCLYLLLKFLEYKGIFDIQYDIREASCEFLRNLNINNSDCFDENSEKNFQDIFFFKKTIRIIKDKLSENRIEKKVFLDFILKNIKFLYINVPESQATNVFSMMNGNKAEMKAEEIIKAEMLRLVSTEKKYSLRELSGSELLNVLFEKVKEVESIHWEQNLLRSKYAREWDKWLYWWNRDDVAEFYHTNKCVMGLLVKTYLKSKKEKIAEDGRFFEEFRDTLLRGDNNEMLAKNVFYEMRHLQKKFEDVFNDNVLYNKIGAIITLHRNDDRERFIKWYFTGSDAKDIESYYKLIFLGLSHTVIVGNHTADDETPDIIELEKLKMIEALSNDNLYNEEKEHAFRQLLRLNIEEDIRLERRFNFTIWNQRSLEHIFPKSKVYHIDDTTQKTVVGVYGENSKDIELTTTKEGMIDRKLFDGNGSEHCIGNLVLLYKNENSKFGAKDVEEKKKIYFTPDNKEIKFKSRNLLHTISVFAKGNWGVEEDENGIPWVVSTIQNNKSEFINKVKEYYGIQ